jgi:hypothetical protein
MCYKSLVTAAGQGSWLCGGHKARPPSGSGLPWLFLGMGQTLGHLTLNLAVKKFKDVILKYLCLTKISHSGSIFATYIEDKLERMTDCHGSKVDNGHTRKERTLLEIKVHRQQTNIIMKIEMTAMFI